MAFENGVRTPGTQGTEKRCRMRPDAAPAPQMQDKLLLMIVGLVKPNLCGSLPGLSTSNTCAALTHEVHTLQCPSLKASTLFLDIKGSFDNISCSVLTSLLRHKVIPHYLVSCVRSFLTERKCRLVFQGSPNISLPVQVDTPQGSPVSPLLFVIYISVFHISIPGGIMFSYVDNFTITLGSLSYRRNCQLFQHLYPVLKRRGVRIGVSFSVAKSEVSHWRTPKDRDSTLRAAVCLDMIVFQPFSSIQ